MTVPNTLELAGALKIGPPQPTSSPFPTGLSVYSLNFKETVNQSSCRALSVNSPSPGFFDLLVGSGIAAVRFIFVKFRSGTFTLRWSTAAGNDQVTRASRQFILYNPEPGSEITALSIQGVGDLEIALAGDP